MKKVIHYYSISVADPAAILPIPTSFCASGTNTGTEGKRARH